MRTLAISVTAILLTTIAIGQESPSYRITGGQFDVGGQAGGSSASNSTSFAIQIGSIGAAVAGPEGSSGSYRLDSGFAAAFRPPGDVENVRFDAAESLRWDAHPSAGDYAVYRGVVTQPFDAAFGSCDQDDLPSPQATVSDTPAPGGAFFYLVTVTNRIREEGSKGQGSIGSRPNPAPCP